jgi:hypothetical protein
MLGEKTKGAIISSSVGTASYMALFGMNSAGVPPHISQAVVVIVGSLADYVLDILLAKQGIAGGLHGRLAFLRASFVSSGFLRFCAVIYLDLMVSALLLHALRRTRILRGVRYRDTILTVLLTVFNYMFMTQNLRFEWAYCSSPDAVLGLTVAVSALALTIVRLARPMTSGASERGR